MRTGALARVTLKRIDKNQTEDTKDDPISQLQKVAIFRTGSERDYLSLSDKKAAFLPSKVGRAIKSACPVGQPVLLALQPTAGR